jgi:hypothetical protein
MKTKFTCLLLVLIVSFFYQFTAAQTAGDYRSNFTTTGLWSTAAGWERFDGVSWLVAGTAPTSADGVITIRSGDSVRLNDVRTIDQVVVEGATGAGNQGVLAIFSTGGTVTLNNDPSGDDIIVNPFGRLYIALATTVSGAGTIHNTAGGWLVLRSGGIVGSATTNDGDLYIGGTGNGTVILTTTLTNNTAATWIDGNSSLSTGATFINNGTLTVLSNAAPLNFNNVSTGNSFVNNGTITRTNATGTLIVFPPFNNAGYIRGLGAYNFSSGTITNTGNLSPGTSPGIMVLNPTMVTGKTPTVHIEIVDGSGAGTGHDRLDLTAATDVSGVTLIVTEITSAPITTYTIMTTTAGNFTGNFASTNIPQGYTLNYTPGTNTVSVTKTMVTLPLVWGDFTALARNNQVKLSWTTLQETNVSHFTVEYSTDGRTYNAIGTLTAAGNTSGPTSYNFTHGIPDLQKNNFYRIRETDLDGKNNLSATRLVRFKTGKVVAVVATPNPMREKLQLAVQGDGIRVVLNDLNGRQVRTLNVAAGNHEINVSDLAPGMYQLSVFEKGELIDTQKLLKL